MKRAFLFLFPAALLCFGTGCASSGKSVLLAQRDPIALVSVVSNRDINWKGEEPLNPGAAGPLTKRALNSDPDLAYVSSADELINTAERLFREAMASSEIINLVEKERVLFSRAYRNAGLNRFQVNNQYEKPANYEFVDFRDKKFPPALAEETGIQRSMFVEFKFTKILASGFSINGSCSAHVEMNVFILDAQGKKIYEQSCSLMGLDRIKLLNRTYSQSGLMGLFEPLITEACHEFLNRLKS